MKQAVKKKENVKVSIKDIKGSLGLKPMNESDFSKSNAEKPMDFITMPPAFENAIKLPGFPMGYMSIITGWSNTGKSTIKNCLIASCINNGILPVIYETESNFDFTYAIDCGMKATPVYGNVEVQHIDEETGEITTSIENQIIEYEGDFIFYDNKLLAEQYGDNDYATSKKTSTKRKIAVIEDIATSINEILDLQEKGGIQQPICFIWDSVGSIPSHASLTRKLGNSMYDAKSISDAFSIITNNRIPSSRKLSEPYANTFVCVNKIWNDSMNSMGGIPSIELKGGKTMYYAARLIIHLGGAGKSSVKKLTATAKGQSYSYGIVTKIKVNKNQLPTPYNITYEGEMNCVHNGLCCPEDIEEYKKVHMKDIIKRIEVLSNGKAQIASASEIEFTEEEAFE